MHRLVEEYLARTYTELASDWRRTGADLMPRIEQVSATFRKQYIMLCRGPVLDERVNKAASYFHEQLSPLVTLVRRTPSKLDNKVQAERLTNNKQDFAESLQLRLRLLEVFTGGEFSPTRFLREKAAALLAVTRAPAERGKAASKRNGETKSRRESAESSQEVLPFDIKHPELYRRLQSWRMITATKRHIKPFQVFSNRTLVAIVNSLPRNLVQLADCPGIGKIKIEAFGQDVINLVSQYIAGQND